MGTVNACTDYRCEGSVGVITIENPPVNALKAEVRAGLEEALKRAAADAEAKAVVLTGGGKMFSAGADITEFNKPLQKPGLNDLIAQIEAMPKPVVAALHVNALAGGLELALACHWRVASPGTKIGLPEVKIGVLPGAGGTQRLPRVAGVETALQMIATGDPIPAEAALKAGAIDAIAQGDVVQAAIEFAKGKVGGPLKERLARNREDKIAEARHNPALFEKAATAATAKSRGRRAPAACVEAVKMALTTPFDDAIRREGELFRELVQGDESKAQRYAFFAEREANKVPGVPADAKPRPMGSAVVIGAGTMGGGIAMCFANAGIPVTIVDTGADALQRGLKVIEGNYARTRDRGGLSDADMQKRMSLIKTSTDLEAEAAKVDVVIEAVFEEMGVKKDIFSRLGKVAKPGALLATNTSTLDVDAIAQASGRPKDVLGTHFFSPANVMRLLEIVRGKDSAPDAIATAIALGRKLAKVPAVVGNCDGFVGNRMLAKRGVEAERLLLEGALPQQVDRVVTEFGFPMGPFAMGDLAGLDVGMRIRRGKGVRAAVSDAICDAGHYGQKTGKGYYRYEKGSRTPVPDPEVEEIILKASKDAGVTRRQIENQEILERMIYPMINEGARILEEKIATRPSDIDVVWLYGYGWPIWRGGPMHYADSVGLKQIADRLSFYAQRSGDKSLEPAPLLKRLAAEGKTFASLAERG